MASLWSWLNTPPTAGDVLDPFGVVCVIVFAIGFLTCAYLSGPGVQRISRNPIQLAGLRHWATVGLWVFGPGLFFFTVRAMQINPLSFGEPIWLVGNGIALVVVAIRCVDWWRTTYPAQLASSTEQNEFSRRLATVSRVPSSPPAPSAHRITAE